MRNHPQRWNLIPTFQQQVSQGYFERLINQFVEPERAEHRIPPQSRHQPLIARQNPRLRPAQQFVSAEADDVYACIATGARNGLVDSAGGKIGEAAGAKILVDGNLTAAAQGSELVERRPLGEAGDAEIRRVDAKQQSRALAVREADWLLRA